MTDLQELGHILIAGVLGAAIGFERQASDKPAGLRTHIFVSAGSAMFILLGQAVISSFDGVDTSVVQSDPIRIIQAIVVGISFLGAGTIVHHAGHNVEGLTTAASIFLTSGIGIAVAVEHYLLAVGTTIFAVAVLTLLRLAETRLGKRQDHQRDVNDPAE